MAKHFAPMTSSLEAIIDDLSEDTGRAKREKKVLLPQCHQINNNYIWLPCTLTIAEQPIRPKIKCRWSYLLKNKCKKSAISHYDKLFINFFHVYIIKCMIHKNRKSILTWNTLLIVSSLLPRFFLKECTNFIFPQYKFHTKLIFEIIAITFISTTIYDASSLSLDKNHTFIGSDFPFMETGPLYSKRNWGSWFSGMQRYLQ